MVGFGSRGTVVAARRPTHKVARAFRHDDPFERRLVRTRWAKIRFSSLGQDEDQRPLPDFDGNVRHESG